METNNLRGAGAGVNDGWLKCAAVRTAIRHNSSSASVPRFLGKLEIDVTLEDPKAYTKPFTVRINQRVMVDEEPIEFTSNENQQFRRRVKIG